MQLTSRRHSLSLYQRLALSIAIAFGLLIYLFYWWSNTLSQQSRFQAEQQLHIELAEHLAQDNPLLQDGVYDKPALENLFHTLMLLGPAFEFYFLDPNGNILTYSADSNKIKRQSVNLTPIQQLIAQPQQLPVFGDDPRNSDKTKIFSAAPIYQGSKLQGYLYVIIGGEIYDSAFASVKQNQTLIQTTAWLGGSIALLFLLLLALFRTFTLPVKRLASDMQALISADFNLAKVNIQKWRNQPNNEIQQLGNSFTTLVELINSQMSLLEHNDKIRRELLAHLSHDLRTPLAAMKGYVEILTTQNSELKEHEQQEYLNIVNRNLLQLKGLIDQIFELAHLEDGQVSINNEVFPVDELLHDIVAKFALKAQQKSIVITLDSTHEHQLIYSDIAKLERILSNLIENALRHTPKHGKITLAIKEQNDKLIINVSDTGSGIHEKELAYIFDARYRASNSQGKSGKNVGLGLAISKKLTSLLNGELSVVSRLGKGCVFSLALGQKVPS